MGVSPRLGETGSGCSPGFWGAAGWGRGGTHDTVAAGGGGRTRHPASPETSRGGTAPASPTRFLEGVGDGRGGGGVGCC